jgi:hypothetical protein
MTLRCDISIIPFGDEDYEIPISRLDIHNIGTVESLGFGNDICNYKVEYFDFDHFHKTLVKVSDYEVQNHNRRDGAEVLVQKALRALGQD